MRDSAKPHYRYKEILKMAQDLSNPVTTMPDWVRKKSTGSSFGNVSSEDLTPPRLKVLAGQSPEIINGTPGAVPGNFWMTVLNLNLGKEVTGVPIFMNRSYQLWAPRGSEARGPLASASDGIHWDQPNQKYDVVFPGNPRTYIWETKRTVKESGLHLFGSSQDDDSSSKPAASLTFDMLWLIDLPDGRKQLCIFTGSKTGAKPVQEFLSASGAKGCDRHFQRWLIRIVRKEDKMRNSYFSFEMQFVEILQDPAEGEHTKALNLQYSKSGFASGGAVPEGPDEPPKRTVQAHTIDDDDIPF